MGEEVPGPGVVTSHLLDRTLQDFAAVRANGAPTPDGDIAFDDDPCTTDAAARLTITPPD